MNGTLDAAGESVGPLLVTKDQFTFAMKGSSFVGTVSLWRADGKLSAISSEDWRLVDTFTDDTEYTGFNGGLHYMKATIETGDYTSGSAKVWLEG